MKCKECRHYHFHQMITGESCFYSGEIPCDTCSRFSVTQDNFEQATSQTAVKADNCPLCGKPYKVYSYTIADQSACPKCVGEAELNNNPDRI